jgi:molecular chaperone GrpE (heat shock protein)
MSQIRNIHDGLKDMLRGEGVVPMEVGTGEAFDPQRHEIVEAVASDAPHGTVVRVLRRGFMKTMTAHPNETHVLVVRKASVVVSRTQETGNG